MKKKLQPGEKIRVKNKNGDGTGRFLGIDPRSGMPMVAFDNLKVDDGEKKVTLEGVQGYVPHDSIRRE